MHGLLAKKLKVEKSPKRNMMNGVTSIRNLTPTKSGQRFTLKELFDFIDECAKEAERKKEKKERKRKK